jgi:hypothetical protein
MGKSIGEVWKHFERMEKCLHNQYYLARCKHCDMDGKNLMEGRIRTLQNHLKKCKTYVDLLGFTLEDNTEENQVLPSASVSQMEQKTINQVLPSASVSQMEQKTVFSAKRSCKELSSPRESTKQQTKKLKSTNITNFLDRAMTTFEKENLMRRMIEMIADNAMSFNWVERPSTIRFIEALRPSAVRELPSRRFLSGKILSDMAQGCRNERLPKMKKLIEIGCNANLICDGWEDNARTCSCWVSCCIQTS